MHVNTVENLCHNRVDFRWMGVDGLANWKNRPTGHRVRVVNDQVFEASTPPGRLAEIWAT